MKLLLLNPRCGQTYWSLERVLAMTGRKVPDAPLALITVAAILPHAWDYRLVELSVRDVSPDEWAEFDAVLLTGMAVHTSSMLAAVREANAHGKLVVVGGPLAFHVPQVFLDAGADIVVRGELESTAAEVASAIERRATGVIIAASDRPDLSRSPIPRFDLLDLDLYLGLDVQFSRGCPYQCEFCDVTTMLGHRVRTKAPAQILAELQAIYDRGWRRIVFFVDDNLIGSPARARELMTALIPWMESRGYPFDLTTQVSVNLANDPELLDLMVRAGFYRVFVGIETPDEESLRLSGKRQNLAVNLDQACGAMTTAGLQIIAGCIIGFDHEAPGADDRLIAFAARNQIPEMFVTPLQVGPGSRLWTRLEAEGRLLPHGWNDDLGSQTGSVNFEPTRPREEINRELARIYDVLYEPRAFIERTFAHFAKMRPRPFRKPFLMPTRGELRAVAIMLFRRGIVSRSRWAFLKRLASALVSFPARVPAFLAACVMGEHYDEFRTTIRRELAAPRTAQWTHVIENPDTVPGVSRRVAQS